MNEWLFFALGALLGEQAWDRAHYANIRHSLYTLLMVRGGRA